MCVFGKVSSSSSTEPVKRPSDRSSRPPSSSLSYSGPVNDDVRSPGSGGTPGPLSAQQPPGLDSSDPGSFAFATEPHVSKQIRVSEAVREIDSL
ncbi:hypothetical protein DMENIID0001_088570 [Sergentomyia squamirostris]